MEYDYRLTVRGYELDSFGHVNNAVYLNYLEAARWDIFGNKKLLGYFIEKGLFLVVVEISIRYMREAKVFDELVVKTRTELESPYLLYHQEIINDATKKKIAKATVRTLLINNDRIPHDIPEEFL